MKITYYVAASIDGFIAKTDGSVDWLPQPEQGVEDYGYTTFYQSVDALVMGRVTYEQVLSFGDWPYPDKPVLVLSGQSITADQDNVMLYAGISELADKIYQFGYKHIWLVGGGKTASTFLQAGLLDELIVTYIPVALGSGISLFSEPAAETEMEIINSTDYPTGVVQITYGIKP